MKPITAAEWTDLSIGQTFETEGVLQGITDKPIRWTVTSANPDKGSAVVNAKYMGIDVGVFHVVSSKKGVKINGPF